MDSFLTSLLAVALSLIIVFVLTVLVLLTLMIKKARQVHRRGAPMKARVSFWLSIVYAICPLDLLPDPIYFDDIAVLIAGLIHVSTVLKKSAEQRRLEV